jgi:hypothetical protein
MHRFNKYIALFIVLLFVIFVLLPLGFAALAHHYINTGLKNWSQNHPDSSYQIKTLHHGLWSGTQSIEISFGEETLLKLPVTLLYGPVIFDNGVHFGLARIAENNTNIEGLPPTTYSGKIGFLGGVSLNTHTPNPSNLLNFASLLMNMKNPIKLDSIDMEIQSDLISRSINARIMLNQFNFQRKNVKLNFKQIAFSLHDFTETHGDPSANLSLQLHDVDYQDGFNHFIIPNAAFINYEATGSRFEAAEQLWRKQNLSKTDPEISRQFIEFLLLGLNSDSKISLNLKNSTPMGSGTFDLDITFPKLPKAPTPLEIVKHADYQVNLAIPNIHPGPVQGEIPVDFQLNQLLIHENKTDSQVTLSSLFFTIDTLKLLKLNGMNYQSTLSQKFFSNHESWDSQLNIQQFCFMENCMNDFQLSNELKGLNKNGLLDNQGDDLVNILGSLVFENSEKPIDIFPLKSLLTKESEETLNIHTKLYYGNASIDLEITTPNFDPKKGLLQNLVASGVIKISSADLDKIFKIKENTENASKSAQPTDSKASKASTAPIGPYQIQKSDENTDNFKILEFIRQGWINGGFIAKTNEDGVTFETLSFEFMPGKTPQLNHKNFDDLHLAALYANLGDIDSANEILNSSKYQENPTAQKMRMQLLTSPQNTITNTDTNTNTERSDGKSNSGRAEQNNTDQIRSSNQPKPSPLSSS